MTQDYGAGRPKRPPSHPGELLKEIVLPALNMSVKDVARHIGVTRQQLHRIIAQEAGISPEMALRLGKFCGNGPDLWLSMQQAYDLWHASKKSAKAVARIPTFVVTTA